jgi:enoyl-CoA hydratase/carnithine racemase
VEYGLHIEDRPGGIRVLVLSSPKKRNALDPTLLALLRDALLPEASAGVRAFLVRGEGEKAFCAGYDIESLAPPLASSPLPDELLGEVLAMLERHPVPSVALVRGAAFGAGCELAAACDFRVGAEDAVFCMPPARLGVVYAPEGLYRVMALLGRARAKLMFLTGRKVDARAALEWGLLDELRPAADAERTALELCLELAQGAPLAIQGMKRAFGLLSRTQLTTEERAELHQVRRAAFLSEDALEGRQAFLDKRPPRFTGR